ncbi:MAG: DsrE family protein [Thermoproteus sp. AZ2]|jgi:peroxiredoxin family protein|uniref:DsrE family protein n=1 Tax=Thermoproteus sp. AZ2 TaxID=1609232 RepID=A0ACC6V2J4_9CREN|nr:MAG: hypothetical protein TU35_08635 [Thermoproteus sp. AZ2]
MEPVGIIVESADPLRLYAFATFVATEVALGRSVRVFVTGNAVKAFAEAKKGELPPEIDWVNILGEAREIGDVKIYVCETVVKALGVGKPGMADEVTSMFSFLKDLNNVVVF